jgi:large subunit ribosomal protein L6e
MSAKQETPAPATKKFGKGERSVPHHSQKASKYYPAEDDAQPKQVRISPSPLHPGHREALE